MRIPFTQVDAFADAAFGGNPAAVMMLPSWLDDATLLRIAQENNLSETAFLVAVDGGETDFELRWFTPGDEVEMCGHATLASGHVVLSSDTTRERVRFATRHAGVLEVARDGLGYSLSLPERTPLPEALPGVVEALGWTAWSRRCAIRRAMRSWSWTPPRRCAAVRRTSPRWPRPGAML